MPGISVITMTAGLAPATCTALVTPSRAISRRVKSSSGSSCLMDRFGIGVSPLNVRGSAFICQSLRFTASPAIVKNDIYRVFFDMIRVTVVEIDGCMASSAAITHDVMATANRIRGTTKRALPFEVTTVRCGSRRSRAQSARHRPRHRSRSRHRVGGRTGRQAEERRLPARGRLAR